MTGPPQTGYLTVNDELQLEAQRLYFAEESFSVEWKPTVGGINNVTRWVTVRSKSGGDDESFVVRIYNNSNNTPRVKFEHRVLEELSKVPLSFEVPRVKRSISNQRFEILSSGASVCAFHKIDGVLASTTTPCAVGCAAGELSSALSQISSALTEDECPTPPYYAIWQVHHAIGTKGQFEAIVEKAADWFSTDAMQELLARLETIESAVSKYCAILPRQLIHGDLHYDNVLVTESQGESALSTVCGLLDFEFAAFDFRAMELAICLSKYLAEQDPMKYCTEFSDGYFKGSAQCFTAEEIAAVPNLIALRVLSNVVYFVGRAVSGEDTIESITTRAASYVKRLRWLDTHGEELSATLQQVSGKN